MRRSTATVLSLVVLALLLLDVRLATAQSFRAAPQMATKIHPNSIAFADFNTDGLIDMAVPQYEGGLTLYLGDGAEIGRAHV